ncbi:MAG: NAD+ synthase, partial [Thermoplasmata archaeon]|nr:NAD+ synthase [Thermoplasmata archaeon]
MADLVPRFKEEQVFAIQAFIAHSVRESGRKGVVLGLSGGIDSALVARLCADALGAARVLGVALPDGKGGKDLRDARNFAKAIGIQFRVLNIGPIAVAFERRLKVTPTDAVPRGNLRARARMAVLYYIANAEDRVVMGTGNKSEILVGYFTKWGDGGADFLPIGDLYKTQVREMAQSLSLPTEIVDKIPTAGLWPGQTDEGELGISYDELDRILLGLELQMEP